MFTLDDVEEWTREMLRLPKEPDGRGPFSSPNPGGKLEVPLHVPDAREGKFYFSLRESKLKSSLTLGMQSAGRKATLMTRVSQQPLLRLDFAHGINLRHTNPDGSIINGTHLHVWTEEYGDSIAVPITKQAIVECGGDYDNIIMLFEGMRDACSISDALRINWRMAV